MAGGNLDKEFGERAKRLSMATAEQVQEAWELKRESEDRGMTMSLDDALVQTGAITEVQQKNILQQIKAKKGGIKQLGQYKIVRKLGEGGMGAVYLAEDTMLERSVAVKVLSRLFAKDPEFLARFQREARAAGNLNHENICGAYAVGEDKGNHFYVMEYCLGESLSEKLARENLVLVDDALGYTIQVARGLKHAHEQGFVHRDIKPANLMLTPDDVVKILDMGLTKDLADEEQSRHLTANRIGLGTPHYISPEQARSDDDIDGRTDIYSLGATLYHLITGLTPFDAPSAAAVVIKHLSEQVPNPQDHNMDIPDGVVQVVTKMMAKEPDDRYTDCAELIEDLREVMKGHDPRSKVLDASKSSVAARAVTGKKKIGLRKMGRGRKSSGTRLPVQKDAAAALRPAGDRSRRGSSGVRDAIPRRRSTGARTPIEPPDDPRSFERSSKIKEGGAQKYILIGLAAAALTILAWFLAKGLGSKPGNGRPKPDAKKNRSAPILSERLPSRKTIASPGPSSSSPAKHGTSRPTNGSRSKSSGSPAELGSIRDPRVLGQRLLALGERAPRDQIRRLSRLTPPRQSLRTDYSVSLAEGGQDGWHLDYYSTVGIASVAGVRALRVEKGKRRHACYRIFDLVPNRSRVRMRVYQQGLRSMQLSIQTRLGVRFNLPVQMPPAGSWRDVTVNLADAQTDGIRLSNVPFQHIEIHGTPAQGNAGFFAVARFQISSGGR